MSSSDWYEGMTEKHFDLAITKAVAEHVAKIERLQIGHNRYETARKMNSIQWDLAWKTNIKTGKPFDEIIDDMAVFFAAGRTRYAVKAVTKCYDCPNFIWSEDTCTLTGRIASELDLPIWCPLPKDLPGAS